MPLDNNGFPVGDDSNQYQPVSAEETAANKVLFDQISAMLAAADLSGLFTVDTNGQPSGWLWDQITSGVDSEAALQIALENTPQFQARYGIIGEIRAQAATGQAVHVPTVSEVREYEQRVSSMMRAAGLPSFMWDNWADTHQYLRNGLSAVEIEERLGNAWDRVQNSDPLVRQAFSDFYGTLAGDEALAAAYLDPARLQSALDRQSRAAYTRGMGQRLGFSLDQAQSERIADSPATEGGIYERLGQLAQLDSSGIMQETIGESGTDLTTEGVGADAVFFGSGAAAGELERRTISRRAANAAVPGGAVRTQRGLTGVGTANR